MNNTAVCTEVLIVSREIKKRYLVQMVEGLVVCKASQEGKSRDQNVNR